MGLIKSLLVGASVLTLSACGGGGGASSGGASSGSATTSAVTKPLITIDNSNATTLAVDSKASTVESTAAGTGNSIVAANSAGVTTRPTLQLHTINLLVDQNAAVAQISNALQGASATVACAYSGTITASGTIYSSNAFTAGDNVKFTYNNCKGSSTDSTANGAYTIKIINGSKNFSAKKEYNYTAEVTYEAMTTSDTNYTVKVDGATTLVFNNSLLLSSVRMTGSVLTYAVTGGSTSYAVSIKNFDQTVQSTSRNATTIKSVADIHSTYLNGSYHLETTRDMVVNNNGIDSGAFTVTGASGTKLTYNKSSGNDAEVKWYDAQGNPTNVTDLQ